MTAFAWLKHLSNCYLEGTKKGLLNIRKIEDRGRILMTIPQANTDSIKHALYIESWQTVLLTTKCGKLQIW
jgi:hypothetical protein